MRLLFGDGGRIVGSRIDVKRQVVGFTVLSKLSGRFPDYGEAVVALYSNVLDFTPGYTNCYSSVAARSGRVKQIYIASLILMFRVLTLLLT